MKKYKGFYYFLDKDNLWKVLANGDVFIVALDDSKRQGIKRMLHEYNNEETCKQYIEWLLK